LTLALTGIDPFVVPGENPRASIDVGPRSGQLSIESDISWVSHAGVTSESSLLDARRTICRSEFNWMAFTWPRARRKPWFLAGDLGDRRRHRRIPGPSLPRESTVVEHGDMWTGLELDLQPFAAVREDTQWFVIVRSDGCR
jgi:hypothetical protein